MLHYRHGHLDEGAGATFHVKLERELPMARTADSR